MNVVQICIGRFHHFHLARQLERYGILEAIWTGYPRFKLKGETGIPANKIHSFPWFQGSYMAGLRYGLTRLPWLEREWAWRAHQTLDWHVAAQLNHAVSLVALSGSGLNAGRKAQSMGGHYVCDRGSSHIRYQDRILREEYSRWGLTFQGVDPRVIFKEEAEYQQADAITVPSEFVRRSFLEEGVPATKIHKIPYGARLDRFHKNADPDSGKFQVIWVGSVSVRKGFLYLLEAFQQFRHPQKKLVVIGGVHHDLRQLLIGKNLEGVEFKGLVPNAQLADFYSTANVFVLPSIEEGLAMVQGEALACGCPVIASAHTGAEDLFTDGVEGFIVPIRSSSAIQEKLELLAQNPAMRQKMSEAALFRVKQIGGWDTYGDAYAGFLANLSGRSKNSGIKNCV